MESKTALLKDILDKTETESVLVFTRTKSRAKSLARQLDSSGYKVTSLHGNLTQPKRQQALDGFRDGRYEIMIATDIAARGIDVTRISHVINYDMPSTADAYTHRIGRTGRASKTGDAFTFVTGQDVVLAHSLKRVLGEKLQYHSVDGLTMTMPLVASPAPARRSFNGNGGKQNNNRRSFAPSSKSSNGRTKQRSFGSTPRQSWTH
jgi:ATP-dependent RNA helicase RhlE